MSRRDGGSIESGRGKASGRSAAEFCQGKSFAEGTLRWWASRLKRLGDEEAEARAAAAQGAAEVRLARVIDLRWRFDRLAGLVAEKPARDARSGALFVFFGKRKSTLKVLFFDGTGLCRFYERLNQGTFRIPTAPDGVQVLTVELDGVAADDARSVARARREATRSAPVGARDARRSRPSGRYTRPSAQRLTPSEIGCARRIETCSSRSS